MRPVTVATTITAPREQVYDLLADLSLRPAFCGHWLEDYRLARANPRGEGAAARFRIDLPLAREWAEITITTADRPRRIVEDGRIGRRGRSRPRCANPRSPSPLWLSSSSGSWWR